MITLQVTNSDRCRITTVLYAASAETKTDKKLGNIGQKKQRQLGAVFDETS
ncbi:hypothetical protein [Vibrio methylphosphonaticus]|uniref:hypothetical protein n=1 Tax=Vibrio methylphosphonaticus TaxID=2946866 RepID=UPI002029CB04|nr:hypothetical protein [Vibrio methylphosphonaticus]MCL9774700.1 hypothetical protein [Vibrio methylphosphonaticus]